MLVWALESEKHHFISIGAILCAVATSWAVECHAWTGGRVSVERKNRSSQPPVCVALAREALSRMSSQASYLRREEMPYSAAAYTESSSSSSDSSPNSSGDHPSSSEGTSSGSSNREPSGDFRVLTGEFKKAAPAAVVAGLGRPRPPTPVRERQNVSQTTFWGGMTSVSLHPTLPLLACCDVILLKCHQIQKLLLLPTTSVSLLSFSPAPPSVLCGPKLGARHNGRHANVHMNKDLLLCVTWAVRVLCVGCIVPSSAEWTIILREVRPRAKSPLPFYLHSTLLRAKRRPRTPSIVPLVNLLLTISRVCVRVCARACARVRVWRRT